MDKKLLKSLRLIYISLFAIIIMSCVNAVTYEDFTAGYLLLNLTGVNSTYSPLVNISVTNFYTDSSVGQYHNFTRTTNTTLWFDNNLGIANGNFAGSVWIKPSELVGTIFFKGDTVNDVQYILTLVNVTGTYKIDINRQKQGSANAQASFTYTVPLNVWQHIAVTYDGTTLRLYYNGQLNASLATSGNGASGGFSRMSIGSDYQGATPSTFFRGGISNLYYYNRNLTQAEITALADITKASYPFIGAVNTTPSYTVVNTQTPTDINSTTLFLTVNTTVTNGNTYANISGLANPYTTLYHRIVTSLNNGCSVFYQSVCQNNQVYNQNNMTKLSNDKYTYTIDDNYLLAGYYPFNYDFINNNNDNGNYTVDKNHYVKFTILNFSTITNTTYLFLEFDGKNASSGSLDLDIYYCNQTYTTSEPSSSPHCELVDSITPTVYNHIHNKSKHIIRPIVINTVKKTQNSSFVLTTQSPTPKGWKLRYLLNNTYNNQSFSLGTSSWTNTNYIFDVHLHQYLPTDYFQYYTVFNDGLGNSNTSTTATDYYNLTIYNPSGTVFTQPNCSFQLTVTTTGNYSLNFSWLNSTSINNFTVYYNLDVAQDNDICRSSFTDNALCFNPFTKNNVTSTYTLSEINGVTMPKGDYFGMLTSYVSNAGIDHKSYSLSPCNFSICVNNWVKSIQPCISGTKLISYTDSNNCNVQYDLPADNSTYESCVTPATDINMSLDDNLLYLLIGLIIIVVIIVIGLILKRPAFFFIAGLLTIVLGLLLLALGIITALMMIFVVFFGLMLLSITFII